MSTCPAGHTSTADDYCDVCGMPIEAVSPAPAPAAAPAPSGPPLGQACPHCETQNLPEALFCEACGYDFTTGTMPRSASPTAPSTDAPTAPPTAAPTAPATVAVAVADPSAGTPSTADAAVDPSGASGQRPGAGVEWVVEVWIDPDWYHLQDSPDTMPSPGLPVVVPIRSQSVLVGRRSRTRNIEPAIDCEPDSGTSRRQAQLTTDGRRWWVEDLESANGTFVAPASGPLPTDPIPVGAKQELGTDDRIYVGAWTRLVVRRATEEEAASG